MRCFHAKLKQTKMWALAAVLLGTAVLLLVTGHRRKLRRHMCTSRALLRGKTVLITGANSGIGYQTALDLARRQARIILACRNVEAGQSAALSIRAKTNNPNVHFRQLDLASMSSIRLFAEEILECESRVDILINNAGVMVPYFTATLDGFELHMGVNHLGHFLLTNLLLERLKESQPSRVITVSSLLYKNCESFDFENMNSVCEDRMSSQPNNNNAYCQSKLANILFTQELARRLISTGVSAYVISPGVVYTGLGRHSITTLPLLVQPLVSVLLWLLFKSPWEGAQTSIHTAVCSDVEGLSGVFLRDCTPTPLLTPVAKNTDIARKLWTISSQLVGLE